MPFRKQILPYGLFAVLFIVYSGDYYGKLVPTDAVSYISIAEKYASGNFSEAINAYWSPLYCWLIALQLKLGIPVNAAIHFLKLMAGLLVIFFSGKMVKLYKWPAWAELMCMALIAVGAADFALLFATPDALMAAGLSWLLFFIVNGTWVQKPLPAAAGGAVLYFTKAFGFYFFLACIGLFLVWKLLTSKAPFFFYLKRMLVVLTGFLLIVFPWLLAIHHRYGRWITSTAGSYNHNLMQYGGGAIQPALKSGLLPLPDITAYNSWEEITLVHSFIDWNPFKNGVFLKLQLRVVGNNLCGVLQYLRSLHLLLWIALLAGLVMAGYYIMASIKKRMHPNRFRVSAIVTAFIGLYALGYSIAGVDYRYLYIVFIGAFFLFFDATVYWKSRFPATGLLCYLAAVWLVVQSSYRMITDLHLRSNDLKEQMADMPDLQKIIPAGSIIATHTTNSINAMDYWGKWHNHGGLEAYRNQQNAIKALQQYKVQWVLIPEDKMQQYEWLYFYSDTTAETARWQLFQLKVK